MVDMPDMAMKQEEERRRNWLKLPREKRLALRRLHNMTGHCSHAAMTRMLKASGSDRDVIQAVKFFQCQVCAETAKEEKANVTKPPRPAHQQRFNFEVSADVFEVHDAAGARHSVLSLVDVATKFHVAGRVGGGGVPSSRICAQMINTTWLSWAGAPDYFVCDQGVHNRGKVAHLLEAHGTTIRQTAARAPFQLGVGERHGGLLKEIMKRVIHERQLQGADDIAALCSEAAKVKNSLLNHAGYTPSQWVMGFMPEDKTSIFSCDFDENMGVHQNLVSMEEDERGPQDVFQKQLLLRQFAKQAYMEADSCQKIRKSLLRKSVPMRGPYQPGDLVSFLKKDRWLGPARVLANEGRSSLWLVHNGVTVLVAETACRPATSQEILKKHVLELRPSRKRKRMLYLDELDDDPMPFDEDLVTAQNHVTQANRHMQIYKKMIQVGLWHLDLVHLDHPTAYKVDFFNMVDYLYLLDFPHKQLDHLLDSTFQKRWMVILKYHHRLRDNINKKFPPWRNPVHRNQRSLRQQVPLLSLPGTLHCQQVSRQRLL
jgi:hypothetical protein